MDAASATAAVWHRVALDCPVGRTAAGCARPGRYRGGFIGLRVVAEQRHVIERVKRFPRDALRVPRPVLVAARIAARDVRLVVNGVGIRGREACSNAGELVRGFRLHAEMIQAGMRAGWSRLRGLS